MSGQFKRFRQFLKHNETAKGLLLIGIVLLGAVAVWGGIRFALNTEYPILVVSSGSMCPTVSCTLPVGALIVIKGEDASLISTGPDCGIQAVPGNPPGSIIVFRPYPDNPDYLVVHRVRQKVLNGQSLAGFRTQGDANPGCDPWTVPPNQIVGVYQSTIPIPYLGSSILAIRDFMGTPQGILVVVALIVALFALEIIEPSKKKEEPKSPAEPMRPASAPDRESVVSQSYS